MRDNPEWRIFARTMIEILADTAFILTDLVDEPGPLGGELIEARIPFTGQRPGETLILVAPECAGELAGNLLGVEPDDPDAQEKVLDAVGETLNVATGILLEQWFGADVDYRMGVPAVRRRSASGVEGELEEATYWTTLESDLGYRIDAAAVLSV